MHKLLTTNTEILYQHKPLRHFAHAYVAKMNGLVGTRILQFAILPAAAGRRAKYLTHTAGL